MTANVLNAQKDIGWFDKNPSVCRLQETHCRPRMHPNWKCRYGPTFQLGDSLRDNKGNSSRGWHNSKHVHNVAAPWEGQY